MPNTLLTSSMIAKEALPILANNTVMGALVHTNYSNEFMKVGDTITVRKPASFTAIEFDGDVTGEYQDITEGSVDVKLDKLATVDVEVTSKQLTLDIVDFNEQVTRPAMEALMQKIDNDLTGLYIDIPYFYGAGGTTPNELADISGVRGVLNTNKVPMQNRNLVIDTEADVAFTALDIFARVDATGSTAGLLEASLGKKLGMSMFMDQNIRTHAVGAYSALADITITTGAAGATSIVLTSAAGASTAILNKGDVFKLDGNFYVVTAATAAAISGVVTVAIYPALPVAYGDMTAATVVFQIAHVASMAFHKNAFALVSRPLETPMGGADAYVTSIGNGVNVRVVMSYDQDTKTNKISFDVLYGVKTLYKELAARLLG